MTRSATVSSSGQAAPVTALATAAAFRAIAELHGDCAFILDCATGRPAYISPNVNDLLGYGVLDIEQQLARGDEGPLQAVCGGLEERMRRFAGGDGSRLRVVREFELLRPDGSEAAVELTSILLLDEDGRAQSLVGSVRDLSAQRAREREQKRFASMLNHEFRTPLSTIDGAIQRLEATGANADEPTRQRYRKIAGATDRLIAMLDDYLSPERMAATGRGKAANTVAPRLLLEELTAQARAAGRQVTLEAGDLPAAIRGEPAGLRLALKVLLDNALRYTPPDTALRVGGSREGQGVLLVLRDAGPGVPDADLARIFDKGYRGGNAEGVSGSGLGLYMARSVVDVHGGTLEYRAPEDGGAEFRLWLPVRETAGKDLASGGTSSDNCGGERG